MSRQSRAGKPSRKWRNRIGIARADATNTRRVCYTWGLDIARSLTDAGGVGALVQIVDHASQKSFFPAYDGNGNVVALVNGDTRALASVYEYDPFGQGLRADVLDAVVADQPFRFSTKWWDKETGLAYYGHRYYAPGIGRFINRDPSQEAGGINLYGFCVNNPINRWDLLGKVSMPAKQSILHGDPIVVTPPVATASPPPLSIVAQNTYEVGNGSTETVTVENNGTVSISWNSGLEIGNDMALGSLDDAGFGSNDVTGITDPSNETIGTSSQNYAPGTFQPSSIQKDTALASSACYDGGNRLRPAIRLSRYIPRVPMVQMPCFIKTTAMEV